METFIKTKVKPDPKMSKTAAFQQKQTLAQQPRPQEEDERSVPKPDKEHGVLPAIITTLLLVPLMLVIFIGVFICWRKNGMYYI